MAAVFAFVGCGGTGTSASDKSESGKASVSDATGMSDEASDSASGGTSEAEEIVLTDTDFFSLVSEKVTEEEWKAVFDKNAYTNFSVKIINKKEGVSYYKNAEGTIMVSTSEEFVVYYSFTENALKIFAYNPSGECREISVKEGDEEMMK